MKTGRMILKCKVCKKVKAIDIELKWHLVSSGKKECGWYLDGHHLYSSTRYAQFATCCNQRMDSKLIKGELNHAHECGDKCMTSKGPSCSCSCGGANHGRAYL